MLNLQAVNHFYGNQHSLWNVDLVLRPGECIGVLGREGMGKTTLVNCIAGHLPVASGRMTWHDIGAPPQDLTPLSAQSRSAIGIGYVPQDGLTRKASFPASVNEVVLANLYSRIGLFRFPRREHREDVRRTLELVGMQDYGCRMLGELSGGQRQRVQLAQALVSRPALLLLDEPTAGLDAQSTADFYTLLKNLNRERGLSILIVSHDLQEMPRLTDTIYCLSHQKITRLAAKEIRTYV